MSELSFGLHLVRYTNPTTRGGVIPTKTITFTHEGGNPTLSFTLSTLIAGDMPESFYVGVEYRSGSGWVAPQNDLFVAVRDSAREADQSGVHTFTSVLYVSDRLAWSMIEMTDVTDGKLTIQNGSAGSVMTYLMGLHPDLQVTSRFTAQKDSYGRTWPTTDLADHTFTQWANLSDVLGQLTAANFCQWHTEGTELVLEVAGTGTDVSGKVKLGPGAKDVDTTGSVEETASEFFVTSDTNLPVQKVTRPQIGLGRRSALVTVTGAEDAASALRLAEPFIDDAAQPKRQFVVTYDAPSLPAVPFQDFNLGDKVQVRAGGVWEGRVVSGIQVQEAEQTTVVITLGSRFLTTEAKLAQRVAQLTVGSVSNTGGSGKAIVHPAVGVPNAPTGLRVATNVPGYTDQGVAFATVTVAWNPVTSNTAGGGTVVSRYEVWVRTDTTATDPQHTTETASLTVDWSGHVRYVKVRAYNGEWSQFSPEVAVTPALPPTLDPPSVPLLSTALGVVLVEWDGNLTSGPTQPGFWYVLAESAPAKDGPWTRFGAQLRGGGRTLTNGTVGQTLWVRFIARDTLGRLTDPGQAASIVIKGVTLPDVAGDIEDALDAALEAARDAQTTADGRNRVVVYTPEDDEDAPTMTPPPVAGDQWYVTDVDGHFSGVRIHNGTTWVEHRMIADSILVPGSVGGTVIADGGILTNHLAAESVTSEILAAQSVTTDHLEVGSVTVDILEAGIGGLIDITANEAVNFLIGRADAAEDAITTTNDDLSATREDLNSLQTVYSFTGSGAVISTPNGEYSLLLTAEGISILQGTAVVSKWSAGQMQVEDFVGTSVTLANHQVETDGTYTTVKWIGS